MSDNLALPSSEQVLLTDLKQQLREKLNRVRQQIDTIENEFITQLDSVETHINERLNPLYTRIQEQTTTISKLRASQNEQILETLQLSRENENMRSTLNMQQLQRAQMQAQQAQQQAQHHLNSYYTSFRRMNTVRLRNSCYSPLRQPIASNNLPIPPPQRIPLPPSQIRISNIPPRQPPSPIHSQPRVSSTLPRQPMPTATQQPLTNKQSRAVIKAEPQPSTAKQTINRTIAATVNPSESNAANESETISVPIVNHSDSGSGTQSESSEMQSSPPNIRPLQSSRKRSLEVLSSESPDPPSKKQRLESNPFDANAGNKPVSQAKCLALLPSGIVQTLIAAKNEAEIKVSLNITLPRLNDDTNGETSFEHCIKTVTKFKLKPYGYTAKKEKDYQKVDPAWVLSFTPNNALFVLWHRQWLADKYPNNISLKGALSSQQKKSVSAVAIFPFKRRVTVVFIPLALSEYPIRIPVEVEPDSFTDWTNVEKLIREAVATRRRCAQSNIRITMGSPVCIGPSINTIDCQLSVLELMRQPHRNAMHITFHFAAPLNNRLYSIGSETHFYPYFTYPRHSILATSDPTKAMKQVSAMANQCLLTIGGPQLIRHMESNGKQCNLRYWLGNVNAKSLFDMRKDFFDPWTLKPLTDVLDLFHNHSRAQWKPDVDIVILFDHQMYDIYHRSAESRPKY